MTLWAEMKDRTTTGVENEHAGSTLSIRRVDWVIRQTAGITSSMRILYDNVVWDILAINSLSYDRNRMQIVTEQRGQITDADLVTCPNATYTNGGAFTQAIASGATYTAPQITVTDVDGSTRSSLPNIGVVCEWKTVNVRSSDGVQVTSIASYPAGGNYDVLNLRYFNKNGSTFATIAHRSLIRLTNANFAAVVNDSPNSNQANLTIDVDVPLVNSNGDSVGSNITDLFNPAEVDDVNLTDDNGAVGSYPAPTSIVFDGEVDSASYASGTLTIVPISGPSPSGILYPDIAPATSYIDATAAGKDTVALWQAGAYTATKPTNPAVIACLDTSDPLRATMLNDNFFGNKLRFTDTVGNRSSVGATGADRINWRQHNWTGAVQYLVIDHYLKAMYWVQYLDNGGRYSTRTDASGDTWWNWLAYIDSLNIGGYSDWLPIPIDTRLPHSAFSDVGEVAYRNFLIAQRADNRGGCFTGESVDANNFYPFRDNFNFSLITSGAGGSGGEKIGANSFVNTVTQIYPMRIMTDADIAALTP